MEKKIRSYARFLIQECVGLNKGTPLAIPYIKSQEEFVKILKEEALKLGASDVYLMESDASKTRSILESSSLEEIKKNPYFDRSLIKRTYDEKGVIIWPNSYEPGNMKDINEDKIRAMNSIKISSQEDSIRARRIYDFPSCIAAVATKPWANELFPNDENAYEKLWNLIFKVTMMDKEDSIEAWENQIKQNTSRRKLLDELRLKKLTYKNSLGTNLEIGLPENVVWQGTQKTTFDGKKNIIVNMPTYEVFTSPNKNEVNGTVVTSIPMFLRGTKISGITFNFEHGELISFKALENEDVLSRVLDEYKEMKYLGEVAFVDYDSPINNTNMNYKTILIDENRLCHIALGNAFVNAIIGGNKMSEEQLEAHGLNRCRNHIDFMIGTNDLSIVGTDIYGNEVPIFIDGNFAEEKVKEFIKNREG